MPGARRSSVLPLAGLTGVVVGLVVAGFEFLATEVLLEHVLEQDVWVIAAAPGAGLILTALCLRYLARRSPPATTDDYVRAFHDHKHPMSVTDLPGRLLAGITTVGLGGAMGLEGPAILAGSTTGATLQHRLSRLFGRDQARILMTAGAAAGVAAVFRAPATGVIFALEVPYRNDVARRALLPALVASATSYLTFVAIVGTGAVFPSLGEGPQATLGEVFGAVVLGVLAGFGGRSFAWLTHQAKAVALRRRLAVRVAVAAVTLGGLAVLADALYDEPLTLGPGYGAVAWATDPDRGLALLALLFVLRLAATITTFGAGGAGGLFIPLAVQGALMGRFVGALLDRSAAGLFPTLGVAAFLGAGYRTPLASVMFVAETTRGDRYVVPALVAAAVSQLVAGRGSVSAYQRGERAGHLERRFTLPITSALEADVLTVPPDATAGEFVWAHVLGRRQREVPVVDAGRYLGMCRLDDVSRIPRERWDETPVELVMVTDVPAALPTWTFREAIAAMEASDIDRLPVADASGAFIGVVDLDEILKLDEILDDTGT